MLMRDRRHVSSETSCLMSMGVGRSDGRHKADSSLHTSRQSSQDFGQHDGADDGHKQRRQRSPSQQHHIEGFAGTHRVIKSCKK